MVTLYYDLSSNSTKEALIWLKEHEIEYEMKRISMISVKDLMKVLSLTENGFSAILKHPNLMSSEERVEFSIIEIMTFEQGVKFISKHTHLLTNPIIFEDNKLAIGYNTDNMKIFLSREERGL